MCLQSLISFTDCTDFQLRLVTRGYEMLRLVATIRTIINR